MQNNRVRRTQEDRRDEAERRMLEAGARLVAERGLDGLTLKDVGEAAGYSRGLPAHHFGSTEQFQEILVNFVCESYADGFDLRLSQPGLGSFVEIVKSLFSRLDDPLYLCAARIVLSDLSGGMKRSPKIAKVRTETSRALVMHLREGIVRGEVRSTLKPEMAMTIILTGVCAVLELWLSDRSLDIVAAGEEFLAIMLHGLKANSD